MDTQAAIIIVAGIAWSLLFRALHRVHGLDGRAAQLIAVLFSYVVAAGILLAMSGSLNPETLLGQGSLLAVTAGLVYRQAIKPTLSGGA